jgi:predicted RNase H-like HicB family nuclease
MKYVAVYEQTSTGWPAYVPGLTGCVAAGDTREAERLIRDAFAFHLEGLRQSDEPIPQSGTWTGTEVVSE